MKEADVSTGEGQKNGQAAREEFFGTAVAERGEASAEEVRRLRIELSVGQSAIVERIMHEEVASFRERTKNGTEEYAREVSAKIKAEKHPDADSTESSEPETGE